MTAPKNFASMASYLLAGLAILITLLLHLVPAALAGLMVYVLVTRIVQRHLSRFDGRTARIGVTAGVAILIGVSLILMAALIINQLQFSSTEGLAGLWNKLADIIASAHTVLPGWLMERLPTSADDIQAEVVALLKEHAGQLQTVGKDVGVGFVHTLVGSIVGGFVAVSHVSSHTTARPLHAALMQRASRLTQCFEKVVLGQGKIAFINATATAIYLLVVLPLGGIHLPFVKTMILLTLLMGFIPVLGNLVSNFVIVVVSASSGFSAAIMSLLFLVLLHKAEYFLAARIMGSQINAKAWELLTAMLVMEAAFGVPGLVTAPLVYAYVKNELIEQQLV